MHYFIVEQDERTIDLLALQESQGMSKKERSNIYVREHKELAFIDWIDKPHRIVSDRMKQLLQLYAPDLRWNSVVLTAKEAKQQELYWFLELKERDVLSDKSERDHTGRWSRIVLSAKKLKRERVLGAADRCIVHLDVAESLLRRAYTGLRFIPVEMDTD